MMRSEACPLCAAHEGAVHPISVCGNCHDGLHISGALPVSVTGEFSAISDEILQGSGEVAQEIRRSVSAADALKESVERSASSFKGIVDATQGTAASMEEISKLTALQTEAAEEVNRSLDRMSRIAERNALGTEEAASANYDQTVSMQKMAESAHGLTRTSNELEELIAIFKVR